MCRRRTIWVIVASATVVLSLAVFRVELVDEQFGPCVDVGVVHRSDVQRRSHADRDPPGPGRGQRLHCAAQPHRRRRPRSCAR
jgi:hypothetical protein